MHLHIEKAAVPLSLAVSALILLTMSLGGCATDTRFPDATALPGATSAALPGIAGSNYGGHAPLVGAHVYVVQPGTTGYGSPVTGLLTAGGSAKYPTTQNGFWTNGGNASDQFVPVGGDAAGNQFYGVTTDANGEFNITGDYTCTVGRPVMLIAYGGAPSYIGSGPNSFTIASEEAYNDGTGYWFTYTTTQPQLFYVGEPVSVSGNPGASSGFNDSGVVLGVGKHYDGSAAPLTTTSFSFYLPYSAYPSGGLSIPNTTTPSLAPAIFNATTIAVGTPSFNPAAVNMAVLGNCPSSGNFSTPGNGAINYVYMNEISTAATAYALNGYANWSATDQTGNDEFHIGSPNTPQALQGIANAAITAGHLYDITGSGQSTVFAGEGHIARATTASGNGTVPQSLLDTLGNILAACVDSNNTYRLGVGTQSTQCTRLNQYAQDNGVYDTTATTHQAFNIAQAAFNIAHYPQGAGTGTTVGGFGGTQTVTPGTAASAAAYVSALFNLPTGNVPFTPNLSTVPNDFAVAIQWNTGAAASDVEIDAAGNAWAVAGASGMYEITPTGAIGNYTAALSTAGKTLAGVAIDGVNGNIWASGATGIYKFTAGTPTGSLVGGSNSLLGTGLAVDGALNLYQGSGGGLYPGSSVIKENATGTLAGGNFPIAATAVANTAGACAQGVGFVALDSNATAANQNLWTATSQDVFNDYPYVCRFDSLGNLTYLLNVPAASAGQAGGFVYPHGMATDAGNNAWFPEKNSDSLFKVAAGTTTNNTGYTNLQLRGQLSAPQGIAVDGANTVWVSNTGDLPATTGPKYATGLVQFSDALTLLTPNFITGASYTTTPTTSLGSVAIDPSGNVWATQGQIFGGAAPTTVYEYIGLGTPTVTPIAAAKATLKVGVRP